MKFRWGFLTFCLLLTSLPGRSAFGEGDVDVHDALEQAQKRHDQVAIKLYNLRHQAVRIDEDTGDTEFLKAGTLPAVKVGILNAKDAAKEEKDRAGNFFTRNLLGSKADRDEKKRAYQQAQAYKNSAQIQTKVRSDLKKEEERLQKEEADLNRDLTLLTHLQGTLCVASPTHCKVPRKKLTASLQSLVTRSSAIATQQGYAPIPTTSLSHSSPDDAALECQRKHLYPPGESGHSFAGFGDMTKLSGDEVEDHERILDPDLKKVAALGAHLNHRFPQPNMYVSAMARAARQASLYKGEDNNPPDQSRYRAFRDYAVCVHDVFAGVVHRYGGNAGYAGGGGCELPLRPLARTEDHARDHMSFLDQLSGAMRGPEDSPREERIAAPVGRTLSTTQLNSAHASLGTLVSSFRELYANPNLPLQEALFTQNLVPAADRLLRTTHPLEALYAIEHLRNEPGFQRAMAELPDSPATIRKAKQAFFASLKNVVPMIPRLVEHHAQVLAPRFQELAAHRQELGGGTQPSRSSISEKSKDHQSSASGSELGSPRKHSGRSSGSFDDEDLPFFQLTERNSVDLAALLAAESWLESHDSKSKSQAGRSESQSSSSAAGSASGISKIPGLISDYFARRSFTPLSKANEQRAHQLLDAMASAPQIAHLSGDRDGIKKITEKIAIMKDSKRSIQDRISALDYLYGQRIFEDPETHIKPNYKELKQLFLTAQTSPVNSSVNASSNPTTPQTPSETLVLKLKPAPHTSEQTESTSESEDAGSTPALSKKSSIAPNGVKAATQTKPTDVTINSGAKSPRSSSPQSSSQDESDSSSESSEVAEVAYYPDQYKKKYRRDAARFEAADKLVDKYELRGLTNASAEQFSNLVKQYHDLAAKGKKLNSKEEAQLEELGRNINAHEAMRFAKNEEKWKKYKARVWEELNEEKQDRKPGSSPALSKNSSRGDLDSSDSKSLSAKGQPKKKPAYSRSSSTSEVSDSTTHSSEEGVSDSTTTDSQRKAASKVVTALPVAKPGSGKKDKTEEDDSGASDSSTNEEDRNAAKKTKPTTESLRKQIDESKKKVDPNPPM